MVKKIKNTILLAFVYLFIGLACFADVSSNEQNFSITIPKAIHINGIGLSAQTQTHGVPLDGSTTFNLEVIESENNDYWELTTVAPVGISISYNADGSILAVFASMTRVNDGYNIPDKDISIYPSKVIFATGPNGGGDSQRIFHFHPKIRVSKDTPPGNYIGNITFTVLAQ
ncbi:MAG: hypothetical protein AB7V50_09340 [Vampirovibrionia bacterium]